MPGPPPDRGPCSLLGSFAVYPLGLASAGPLAAALTIRPALALAGGTMVVSSLGLLAVPSVRNQVGPDRGLPAADSGALVALGQREPVVPGQVPADETGPIERPSGGDPSRDKGGEVLLQ